MDAGLGALVASPGAGSRRSSAVRDLIASLAEGISRHLHEVARLVPGAKLVVQLDEPGLPAVLTGTLPTASGFGRLRAIQEPVIVEGLQAVLDAATAAGAIGTVLHSCAPDLPIEMLVKTGAGLCRWTCRCCAPPAGSSWRWQSKAARSSGPGRFLPPATPRAGPEPGLTRWLTGSGRRGALLDWT